MIYFWCAVKMKFSVRSSIGLRVRERKLQIIVKMNMNVGSSCVFKKCCACEFMKLIYCKIFWSRNRKNLKIEKSVKNSEFEKTFWVNSTQELDTSCPGFFSSLNQATTNCKKIHLIRTTVLTLGLKSLGNQPDVSIVLDFTFEFSNFNR